MKYIGTKPVICTKIVKLTVVVNYINTVKTAFDLNFD